MAFKEPHFIHVLLMRFAADVLARSVYKKRIESLNLRGNERVLDFGSGPGVAAKFIAQELQKGNGTTLKLKIGVLPISPAYTP